MGVRGIWDYYDGRVCNSINNTTSLQQSPSKLLSSHHSISSPLQDVPEDAPSPQARRNNCPQSERGAFPVPATRSSPSAARPRARPGEPVLQEAKRSKIHCSVQPGRRRSLRQGQDTVSFLAHAVGEWRQRGKKEKIFFIQEEKKTCIRSRETFGPDTGSPREKRCRFLFRLRPGEHAASKTPTLVIVPSFRRRRRGRRRSRRLVPEKRLSAKHQIERFSRRRRRNRLVRKQRWRKSCSPTQTSPSNRLPTLHVHPIKERG